MPVFAIVPGFGEHEGSPTVLPVESFTVQVKSRVSAKPAMGAEVALIATAWNWSEVFEEPCVMRTGPACEPVDKANSRPKFWTVCMSVVVLAIKFASPRYCAVMVTLPPSFAGKVIVQLAVLLPPDVAIATAEQ